MASSPVSSFPRSRRGPPLNEYLDYPEARLNFLYLPGEPAIVGAIDELYHRPEAVTYKTLEAILAIVYRPRMMMLLVNQRAIPSSMNILEAYAARDGSSNGSVFEHAFGFLGVHVLALILQAGMLHSFNGWLEHLPLVLEGGQTYNWIIKAPALFPDFILTLLDQLVKPTTPTWAEISQMPPYKFHWCADTWGAERACLPSVGGFTFCNAEFILRQLFDNRNTFLECCVRTGAAAWSILLFVLECHIREQSLGDERVRASWKKQRDIVHRYFLVSGADEDIFLREICISYRNHYYSEFEGRSSAVDVEDAQLMQKAYTRKFHPNNRKNDPESPTLGPSHTLPVTWYVRDNLADYPSLGLVAGETTMEVVWGVLLNENGNAKSRWTDLFLVGNLSMFTILLRSGDARFISGAITLLHKIDVINMFGRYLLLPCYLRNNIPNILDEAPDADPTTTMRTKGLPAINQIADALEVAFKQANTPRILDDFYPDWFKVLLFLHQATQLYYRVSYLHRLSIESKAVWMNLGLALGFVEHLKHRAGWHACMYARCSTPAAARFEDRSIRYCDPRCQAAASLSMEFESRVKP
ncbi:hypothetical protein FRC08_007326 [Ceratobasidium sp. 394]|nr:hypothetical protein FRC08_007326 [Ceratobasidium sp. 394]